MRYAPPCKGGEVMVYVYLRPMPGYCHEMVSPNTDGSYTIVINEALSDEQKLEAYSHALRHIEGCDFSQEDVQEIEKEAHEKRKIVQ